MNMENQLQNKYRSPSLSSNFEKGTYYIIFIAIFLKCTALIPTIFNVYYTQSASSINYLTIIFLFVAFSSLAIIAISKQYYPQLFLFMIGIISTIILFAMKMHYENGFTMKFQPPPFSSNSDNTEDSYKKSVEVYEKAVLGNNNQK